MKVAIRRYDDQTFVDPKGLAAVEAAEKEVEHLTARIGQLAAVDGAVLMTDRMRLLGVGAEVTVHSDVAQVMRGDGTSVPIEAFGTRHRAAFRFCAFYPAGVAIVCSQDGGAKVIETQEGVVRMFGG